VIDVTNNYVEHPEVVADRLERFDNVVGRERVIASTDSGFAAFAGDQMVDPRVVLKKLESLVALRPAPPRDAGRPRRSSA
jgi:5-methyltetrahydropteroyltriglutamate--homocysteine methyltransferase